MKKLVLTLVLGVFAFGSSGFSAVSQSLVKRTPNCDQLMQNTFAAYYNSGYDEDESFQAAIWAYEGCIGNGGSTNSIN